MEELRSTEVLDKEIRADSTKKAARVLSKAQKTAASLIDGVETRLEQAAEAAKKASQEKMQKLKDMPSVGKLPLLRHCQEVQIVIFPLFWDLHLQKIRRYWDCVLFMIRKESIMEGQ